MPDVCRVFVSRVFLFVAGSMMVVEALIGNLAFEAHWAIVILASDGTTTWVLVVAVIGTETMKAVSPTNLIVETSKATVSQTKLILIETGFPSSKRQEPKEGWKVQTLDPQRTALTMIRAATLVATDRHRPVDRTIVMAQMPRTEAEELAVHLKTSVYEPDCSHQREYRQ
jgi:hypothetical protein